MLVLHLQNVISKLNPHSMKIVLDNVNLDLLLKNPRLLGDTCYNLRKSLSNEGLTPKSFFANYLNCEIKELGQIESGFVYNMPLAIRYLVALVSIKKLFS